MFALSIQFNRCHRAQLRKEQLQAGNGGHVRRYLKFTFIQPSLECSLPCLGPRGEGGQQAANYDRVSLRRHFKAGREGVVGLAFDNAEGI